MCYKIMIHCFEVFLVILSKIFYIQLTLENFTEHENHLHGLFLGSISRVLDSVGLGQDLIASHF